MTDKRKIFLPLIVIALGAVVAVVIVRARPAVERVEATAPPPLVRALEVVQNDVELRVSSQGTVVPRTESTLVSQVSGRVESVSPRFAEGGFFSAGEVLVKIDPRDYELAVDQAEAQVAQATVRREIENAEAELALEEWESLGRGEPTSLTLREPQLAEAAAALAAAEARLEQARLQLERTTLRVPFAGRVRKKMVDVGQFVSPGSQLATVYSTDYAEVRLPVRQADLAFLEVDLGAATGEGPEVLLSGNLSGATRTWTGRIVRTGSEFDPRSRMLPLYVRVEDPFGLRSRDIGSHPLPIGLFVEAEIVGRSVPGLATLPRTALRSDDQVLVVDSDDRLRFRRVDIFRVQDSEVLIDGGLEAGERVCISPLESVVDGMRVRVAADEAAAAEATPEARS